MSGLSGQAHSSVWRIMVCRTKLNIVFHPILHFIMRIRRVLFHGLALHLFLSLRWSVWVDTLRYIHIRNPWDRLILSREGSAFCDVRFEGAIWERHRCEQLLKKSPNCKHMEHRFDVLLFMECSEQVGSRAEHIPRVIRIPLVIHILSTQTLTISQWFQILACGFLVGDEWYIILINWLDKESLNSWINEFMNSFIQ